MNEHNPQSEELAPLDAFEQQWVDQLAQREPDLVQTEDAFVQSVMQAEAASAAGSPAVLARIGRAILPYAVAAAVLLVGYVGFVVLKNELTDEPTIAKENIEPTQPDDAPSVVPHVQPKVELGKLIANVKSTATSPATNLPTTVSEASQTISIDRLFDLLDGSVPNLKELMAPLEAKDEQSRA